MPLGNGGPLGVPTRLQANVFADRRAYTTGDSPPGSTLYTPLTGQGAFGASPGFMSPYARVISTTPGLAHWFRLGKTYTTVQADVASPPYFDSSVSAQSLRTQGGGTPKLAPSLVPGDPDPACDLNGGYLDGWNYFVKGLGTQEILSAEAWCYLRTLKADTALVGAWGASAGWMLYMNGSTLSQYANATHVDAAAALSTNTLMHIVGVWGGIQTPTPDYYSYVYVNGVQVLHNLLAPSGSLDTVNSRFEIGQYSNGGGSNAVDGIVDEVSLYTRMLQPAEILQHYQAGFARGPGDRIFPF